MDLRTQLTPVATGAFAVYLLPLPKALQTRAAVAFGMGCLAMIYALRTFAANHNTDYNTADRKLKQGQLKFLLSPLRVVVGDAVADDVSKAIPSELLFGAFTLLVFLIVDGTADVALVLIAPVVGALASITGSGFLTQT